MSQDQSYQHRRGEPSPNRRYSTDEPLASSSENTPPIASAPPMDDEKVSNTKV